MEALQKKLLEKEAEVKTMKSKMELSARGRIGQVEKSKEEALKAGEVEAEAARQETIEVRRAMEVERKAFEKEVAKYREEAMQARLEVQAAEGKVSQLEVEKLL